MKTRVSVLMAGVLMLLWALPAAAQQRPATPPFAPVDNDVYLHSSELYRILNRYRAGDHHEMLPDLRAEVRRRPNLPSGRFWLGFRLLTLSFMTGSDERNPVADAAIKAEFDTCLRIVPQLAKLPGRAHAALYYKAMCHGGLAMLSVAQSRYIDGGSHARQSMKAFETLHKNRPDVQAGLFAMGAYNYITARLGTFGKVVLWMLDLPRGERHKGLDLLQKALKAKGPFDTLIRFTLAPIFNNHEDNPAASLKIADSLVKLVPYNATAHFSHSVQLLLAGKLQQSHEAMEQAFRLMPPREKDKALREFAYQRRYMNIVAAVQDILLFQKPEALQRLYRYNERKKHVPRSVPASAAFYTAHLFKLAGLESKAREMYLRVYHSQAARGLRDRAGTYMDEKNISGQIRLSKEQKARLRTFLADKPLPNAFK